MWQFVFYILHCNLGLYLVYKPVNHLGTISYLTGIHGKSTIAIKLGPFIDDSTSTTYFGFLIQGYQ